MTDAPLMSRLAQHLQRPVPEHIRQRARLHLLDWLACVAGARESEVARHYSRHSSGFGWHDGASLLGNVLEMDDVHRSSLLHPGPIVWGTVASTYPNEMNELLDMAAAGYEAMIAVGGTLDEHHYRFWHPTATAGYFGAAATAARYLELNAEQTGWALGNSGSVAGGFWHMRHTNSMAKQWHILNASRAGYEAASAALYGLTGPLAILEGSQGLWAATCREPKPMVLDPDRWRIEEVSFKPFAACRHAHPAIDAAMQLRAAGRLRPPFEVATYRDALVFCDNPAPRTATEAKFSLQHAVAVVADGRDAAPADFEPEAIVALAALRAQVSVAEDAAITARYPAHFGARVNDLEVVDTLGDPERPMSEAQHRAKLRMLVAWGGLPPAEADRAADLALHGEDATAIVTMLEEWLA